MVCDANGMVTMDKAGGSVEIIFHKLEPQIGFLEGVKNASNPPKMAIWTSGRAVLDNFLTDFLLFANHLQSASKTFLDQKGHQTAHVFVPVEINAVPVTIQKYLVHKA